MARTGIALVRNVSTGTSAKTLLQLIAAANQRVKVLEVGVFFAGTSSTATPIDVELQRQTSAGTMSALVAGTDLNPLDDSLAESLTTTGQHTATVEPTADAPLFVAHIHPQSGIAWRPPADLWIGGGDRMGLVVTAAADVNATAYIMFEE